MPRSDHHHLPHWPLEREGASSPQNQARRYSLARRRDHQRRPPGGASIHLVGLGEGLGVGGCPHSLGTCSLSDQREKQLDGAMPCCPDPAQFLSTEACPGVPTLVKSLEPTTFSLKNRGLSCDFTVGSVTGNRTQ